VGKHLKPDRRRKNPPHRLLPSSEASSM